MKPPTIVIAIGPPDNPEARFLAEELRRLARQLARERGLKVRTRSV